MGPIPSRLSRTLRRQHGLVTWAQLGDMTSFRRARSLLAAGVLVPTAHGVYRSAVAERSYPQDVLACCLSIGEPVAGCGLTAAHLWDVEKVVTPDKVYLVVQADRHPRNRDGLHVRRGTLPLFDIATRHGVPVTTATRTVLDLSARVPASLVRLVARDLLRRGELTPADLVGRISQKPVPTFDRDLVENLMRETEAGVGESAREDWIRDVLVGAGLPEPQRQVPVEINGKRYRLDLAYVDSKIALEYDSWEFHQDRRAFNRDRHKSADLQSDAWVVLQVASDWSARQVVELTKRAIAVQTERLSREVSPQARANPKPASGQTPA